MTASIDTTGAGVCFQFDRYRRLLTPTLARIRREQSRLWALRGIDLRVGPGEGVALVGPSGSGKTTLLRMLGGVLVPDEGSIDVRGRVGTLLSTQAGLIGPLTGRENTDLLGVLGGMSATGARAALPAVRELSGLGDAFDRPVASYSQGMRSRLGFAVVAQQEVQVLLLDEVYEALDHEFRAVVAERALAIRRRGGIVVAAGHDHAALEALCDRAVLLRDGGVAADGDLHDVIDDHVASGVTP